MKVISTPEPNPFADSWHPLVGQVESDEKHQVRCEVCSKYLKSRRQRVEHCKKFHPEVNYWCEYFTDLDFYVMDDLVQHCKENHVMCFICETYFRNDGDLQAHKDTHHQPIQPPQLAPQQPTSATQEVQPAPTAKSPQGADSPEGEPDTPGDSSAAVPSTSQQSSFVCGICRTRCTTSDSFRIHLAMHKKTKCTFCPKKFYNVAELNSHVRSDHPSQKEDVKCIVLNCFRVFVSWKEMWIHVRACHCCDMPFRCSESDCFVCFKTIEGLMRHGECHDKRSWDSETKCYHCSLCSEVFDTFIQVKVHGQTHPENKYKCDECDYHFHSISELSLHGRDCHDSRHTACRSCPYYCDTAEDLAKHVRQHHYSECAICFDSFSTPEELTNHELDKHGGSQEPGEDAELLRRREEKFKHYQQAKDRREKAKETATLAEYHDCPHCLKSFKSAMELDDHTMTEHSYVCPACHAVFTKKSTKDKHIQELHPSLRVEEWRKKANKKAAEEAAARVAKDRAETAKWKRAQEAKLKERERKRRKIKREEEQEEKQKEKPKEKPEEEPEEEETNETYHPSEDQGDQSMVDPDYEPSKKELKEADKEGDE